MPEVAPGLPQGGSVQQCLVELASNIYLLGTQNSADNASNIAALEESLSGPFRSIVKSIQDIIMGEKGVTKELKSIVDEFLPTTMDQFTQQMQEGPTRLISGIVNSSTNLVSQLYQYGSAELGAILDSVKNLLHSLLFFNPESILGITYQGLVFGLPSVLLQKQSLYTLRKLISDTNKDVRLGKIPKQINPSNPFSEAHEELCKAMKDFKLIETELINKNKFNKGACSTGTQHIFRARDTLIEGKNSQEFLEDFAANQFGIADQDVQDFVNRQWLPPIEIGLRKEGIVALLRPISQTNNNIKTMQDNISGLIEKLQLNVKFENILVLFVRFIQNEIARYQNALLAATGDPNGKINQMENKRAMLFNQLTILKSNPRASEAKKSELQDEILLLDKTIIVEKEKVAHQSPEEFNTPTLLNSMAVQLEVAIGLSILGMIAQSICIAISKFESIWTQVTSLNQNSWFRRFNEILEGLGPANCPAFYGNNVLCSMGKYLDALNQRLILAKNSSDAKVLSLGNELLRNINFQLRYLECIERKVTQGSQEMLAMLLATGGTALIASMITNGLSMNMIMGMLGLDFELWFLKSTANTYYESILKSLVCLLQSCDNPGMTRYVNQLMTVINEDKRAEDTRSVDFRHMAKEAQSSPTYSSNSRIKFFMDMLSNISAHGFSLCIPGSSGFDKNKTKKTYNSNVASGNTFEKIFCANFISPAPQSPIMGNDPFRVGRVFA